MAYEPSKREKMRKALGENPIPSFVLPNREEPELVTASYTIEKRNKDKLARVAKAHGYGKSTSEFLNNLITSIKE